MNECGISRLPVFRQTKALRRINQLLDVKAPFSKVCSQENVTLGSLDSKLGNLARKSTSTLDKVVDVTV